MANMWSLNRPPHSAKVTQESGKQLIKNLDDVRHLVR
jgi:hypothetical protein